MPENSKSPGHRFRLISAFLVLGIVSLVQPGCDCSSMEGGTGTPSAVTSVSPLSSSTTSLVTTDVSAVFGDEMNAATVESGFSLSLNSTPVSATVSYDAASRTATLLPAADLVSNMQYRATIASSVKGINGNSPLSTDYIWSFTTSPAMLLTSKNASGVTTNDTSSAADIDATGRYIVFESEATNLTSVATTLNRSNIYRKDTITGAVILVSSDDSGLVEADNHASNPGISTNGRYVVFESNATNLDTVVFVSPNGPSQIYLKDLEDGSVDLVSRSNLLAPDNSLIGATNASVSDDGRYIIFQSADNDLSLTSGNTFTQIYLKDMGDESVEMISRNNAADLAGNDDSGNPDMNADGTHIVFESSATNFSASNSFNNIYYIDTSVAHTLELISVVTGGAAEANGNSNNPSISNDGSSIVFHTDATNLDVLDNNGLVDVYLHYRPLVFNSLISANPSNANSGNGASSNAHISGNADYVVFESRASDLAAGSTSAIKNILVRDLSAWPAITIEKLDIPTKTVDSNGPVISTDGRYVSFHSIAPYTIDDTDTLSDVFRVHNSVQP
jgi:Tol biopolymer transport system component